MYALSLTFSDIHLQAHRPPSSGAEARYSLTRQFFEVRPLHLHRLRPSSTHHVHTRVSYA